MTGKLTTAPFQYQTNLFHRDLIMEDNDVIHRVNAEVLIRSGCEVNVAIDGVVGQSAQPAGWRDQPLAAGIKISLQNSKTGQFMRCDSVWTWDIKEALNFLSVRRAISFGMNELKDSFRVLKIEDSDLLGTVIIAISNLLGSPQLSCESQYPASTILFNRPQRCERTSELTQIAYSVNTP